jgi:carbamate kinase
MEADLLVMATDVEGVFTNWGTPEAAVLGTVTPTELENCEFAAGSMGPKVAAAIQFVRGTGNRAAIGALGDIDDIVAGTAGTNIVSELVAG